MKPLILLFSLCTTLLVQADINSIPQQDLNNIKYLFEGLIDWHDYSYTIFGSKPMSLADLSIKPTPTRSPNKWINSKLFISKRITCLNAWYRYRDEFDSKDFIFLADESDWIKDCLVLFLINKKNMLRALHEHESIFKEILGDSFTPESFLAKIEKREISLAKAINNSQTLMGLMLGYGVRNATLFQERFDLMRTAWKREKENLPEDEILTKKLADIETQCGCFSELDADATIHPLYFLADVSHPESIALKKQYEKERQEIIELRKKPNFMDLVLERLEATD